VENAAMAKNTSVVIGDHFAEFIDRQVSQGRYASASDVVRAGLRLLEERETEVEALRAALIEGEQSGASTPFDFDEFVKRKRQRKGRARDRA
jgi:antitoxin ParD1/3/4